MVNNLRKALCDQSVNAEFEMECETEFDIIQILIEERKSQNLTQEELAARTGIYQTSISRIEKRLSNPSVKMFQRLAAGMGMTLSLKKL